jgi:hypothetical protein
MTREELQRAARLFNRIANGDTMWKEEAANLLDAIRYDVMNQENEMKPKYENGQNENRINNNFKYHPPKDDQPERYELIRDAARKLAHVINDNTPSSREQSLAFTALEEVVFQSNAAIARNE